MSCAKCHESSVMCEVSGVMCQVSCVSVKSDVSNIMGQVSSCNRVSVLSFFRVIERGLPSSAEVIKDTEDSSYFSGFYSTFLYI